MRLIFGIILSGVFGFQANAVHIYANYKCESDQNIQLNYDGPGSNYAVGGYSHFYVQNDERGFLSYEDLEDRGSNDVGEIIGNSGPLQVTFAVLDNRTHGEVRTKPVDPSKCEGFEYEHSEWTSIRVIKITGISDLASVSLGLTEGNLIAMKCEETLDVPVKCNED